MIWRSCGAGCNSFYIEYQAWGQALAFGQWAHQAAAVQRGTRIPSRWRGCSRWRGSAGHPGTQLGGREAQRSVLCSLHLSLSCLTTELTLWVPKNPEGTWREPGITFGMKGELKHKVAPAAACSPRPTALLVPLRVRGYHSRSCNCFKSILPLMILLIFENWLELTALFLTHLWATICQWRNRACGMNFSTVGF